MKFFMDNWGAGFLGHYAIRLGDILARQGEDLLKEKGWLTPSLSVSTILFLSSNGEATVTDISVAVGVSHQLAAQRINELEKLGLVKRVPNQQDKRSRLIVLTDSGQKEAGELDLFVQETSRALRVLEEEIACSLSQTICDAVEALERNPLKNRYATENNRQSNE